MVLPSNTAQHGAVQGSAVLCRPVKCHDGTSSAVQRSAAQCSAAQRSAVQFSAAHCSAAHCDAALLDAKDHCTPEVLCCTVLHCAGSRSSMLLADVACSAVAQSQHRSGYKTAQCSTVLYCTVL